MIGEVAAAVSVGMGVVMWWTCRSMKPPPAKAVAVGSSSSPRIRLSDGRYLSYKEIGIPKEKAKFKVILSHGFNSSKDLYLPLSQRVMEEVGVYVVAIDRAGYGESDPNPKKSPKKDAFDIQELADQLKLGSKFYVVGLSIGTYSIWGCLKYIPHRLAGVALVSPVINFWWDSLPPKLSNEAFQNLLPRDRLSFRVAHHVPGLFWPLQKWLPASSMLSLKGFMEINPNVYNHSDKEIFRRMAQIPNPNGYKVQQQGVHESLHRDIMVFFGKWEFDPTDLKDPNPDKDGSVHLWQGTEDGMAPVQLQRHIAQNLPWVRYHEIPGAGHLIIHDEGFCEAIFRALLLGEEPSLVDLGATRNLCP